MAKKVEDSGNSDNTGGTQRVVTIELRDEMRRSFMDYAMSVIVSRAIPDVRDGLKPVHRRIIYGMYELGLSPTDRYRKAAKTVGDVMGNYHPHGDSAIYESLVKLTNHRPVDMCLWMDTAILVIWTILQPLCVIQKPGWRPWPWKCSPI